MSDGCTAYKVSRVILFIFNVVFFSLGLAALGIGIYAKVHSTKYDDYLTVIDQSNSTWENFGVLCIIVGVICIVLGFSGLYGAAKEKKRWIIFFIVICSIILILEIVGGGLAYGYRNTLKSKARDGMVKTIKQYNNTESVMKSWDNIQKDLTCCGVESSADWIVYGDGVPGSCFCTSEDGCGSAAQNGTFTKGCYQSVVDEVQGSWAEWGGALIAFAVMQLVGIISGIVFVRKIKDVGYYLA